jgi:hypothetical protein
MASRYTVVPGGGYLPSPVAVVLQLNGQIVQGVISGTYVQTPQNAQLNWRYRVYWQKSMVIYALTPAGAPQQVSYRLWVKALGPTALRLNPVLFD